MKSIAKVFGIVLVGSALMTSQAFAAGKLHPLDAWETSSEGHLSAMEGVESTDTLKSGYGDPLMDVWGNDIRTNQ
jgi:hypothetical protein